MVDNDLFLDEESFPNDDNARTVQINTPLSDFHSVTIFPTTTILNSDDNLLHTKYNVLVASSGAPGPLSFLLTHRSLTLEETKTGQIFIPSFFSGIRIVPEIQFIVQRNETIDNKISYSIFFSGGNPGGPGSLDLTISTLTAPPGSFPVLPTTVNIPILSTTVLRQIEGNTHVYDYFILSEP